MRISDWSSDVCSSDLLRVASGEPLPKRQDELEINGWAIEARLYAEDPAQGFLPSTGRLEVLDLPDHSLRVETGVEEDDTVTPFYDPMIAKLIASAPTRDEAAEILADELAFTAAWPVKTNAVFLVKALRHPRFLYGAVVTGFIAAPLDSLVPAPSPQEGMWQLAAQLGRAHV